MAPLARQFVTQVVGEPGTMDSDQYYFAYGSNLDPDRKQTRTGPIREARRARLSNYRLAFNKRAAAGGVYANIVSAPGDHVWGIVYRCNPGALTELDRHEGVAAGHYLRKAITVELEGTTCVQAVTYVAGEKFLCAEGTPAPDYLARIIDGARFHRLPEDYVRGVEERARK